MRPLKDKVSITLDEDVVRKIKMMADYQDRSFSQYINLVLKQHILQVEKRTEDIDLDAEAEEA